MNKVILFASGTVITLGALVASSGLAIAANDNAHRMGNSNGNGYTQQLQVKADVLKLNVADLREQLKTRTMTQLAAEKGVSMDAIHAATSKQAHMNWEAKGLSDCDGTGNNEGGMHRHQNNN